MKKVFLFTTILSLIVCAVLVWKLVEKEEKQLKLVTELEKIKYYNTRLESNLFYFNSFKEQNLAPISIYDQSENEISLTSLIDQDQLFFRISRSHCNLCYEREFQRIAGKVPLHNRSKIVVLMSFKKREFRTLARRFEKNLPGVLFVNFEGVLTLEQEKYQEPYYFTSSKNGEVYGFFFPDKAIDEHSYHFLSLIGLTNVDSVY